MRIAGVDDKVMVAGLTGGIGCGKSTVARMFGEQGAVIVDADKVARKVVVPGTRALALIEKEFGPEVIAADGTLKRKVLGNIVFHDQAKLRKLERIMGPRIKQQSWQDIKFWARHEWNSGGFGMDRVVVIFENALLFESKMERDFDRVIVVGCSEKDQLRRVVERDKCSEEHAQARIDNQQSVGKKKQRASYFIDTSWPELSVRSRVVDVMNLLRTCRL